MSCKVCDNYFSIQFYKYDYFGCDCNCEAKFCPNCGKPLTKPEPLTHEQLQHMDKEPVWVRELDEWALVVIDSNGTYKDMPFVKGKHFEYDVGKRKLTCYTNKLRP